MRESSTTAATVYIVDDDISVRESVELLGHSIGCHVETFASAQDFLWRRRSSGPCCLVLDISLPDLSGLELQQRLLEQRVELPIIFITGHGDVPKTVQAMKAGAVEFLTKPLNHRALVDALRQALQRDQVALANEAGLRALQERHASLTPREREVLRLIVAGLLNKQVGFELGISEITVKTHRGRVMRKMRASSFAELMRMATRLRIER